jgi:hypothetical protein
MGRGPKSLAPRRGPEASSSRAPRACPVVDWPLILGGVLAIVPALAVMLLAYGPYDGHFRDNVMFLFFMGGLFAGMVLFMFEALLRTPRGDPLYTWGMVLLGFPILENTLKLMVLNRKAHQGQRATIFYGGSFALGLAVMLTLAKSQNVFFLPAEVPLFAYREIGNLFADPSWLVYFAVVATSLTLAQFATGLVIGDGVRTRALVKSLGVAVVLMVPFNALLFQFAAGLSFGAPSLLWLPLMLAYTIGIAWWAQTKVLPHALPPDAHRKKRRALLAAKRGQQE